MRFVDHKSLEVRNDQQQNLTLVWLPHLVLMQKFQVFMWVENRPIEDFPTMRGPIIDPE